MCMMLIKPANFTLAQNYIESLWSINGHGFGAYCFKTKSIFKTLDKLECETYLSNNHANELFIHFRMSTGGAKTLDNIHPFKLGHDLVLFHNGIMRTTVDNGIMSDTAQYALYWRNKLSDDTTVDGTATTPRQDHLNAIINDLELNEQFSRFTIIDTKTNEAYYPNCADWHSHTTSEDVELIFSNTYAISSKILDIKSKVYEGWDEWGDWVGNDNLTSDELYEETLVVNELQSMLDNGASHAEITSFIEQEAFYVASWLMTQSGNVAGLTMLNDDNDCDNQQCQLFNKGVA